MSEQERIKSVRQSIAYQKQVVEDECNKLAQLEDYLSALENEGIKLRRENRFYEDWRDANFAAGQPKWKCQQCDAIEHYKFMFCPSCYSTKEPMAVLL